MRKRWQSRLLGTAVLVPLFLGAVLPDHLRTLVCRYTGIAMPEEACCPQSGEQDVDAQARLQGESCCVVKTVQLGRLVSDRRPEAAPPGHPPLAARIVVAQIRVPPCDRIRAPYPNPPPLGPPIVLAKHAFLI
jgi:hypothetical protein